MTRHINAPGKLYPVHLKPQDDELLSSWLVRLSIAHGLTPTDLDDTLYPQSKQRLWTHDIDMGLKGDLYVRFKNRDRLLATLSEKTGTPLSRVRETTLDEYEKRLFYRTIKSYLYSWITPYNFNPFQAAQRFGMQACPLCLDDEKPYYRRRWRFAFVVVCPLHKCRLLDRCRSCGAPIRFHQSAARLTHSATKAMTVCYKCWSDFRRSPSRRDKLAAPVAPEVVELQERLVRMDKPYKAKPAKVKTVSAEYYFDRLNRMLSAVVLPHALGRVLQTMIMERYGSGLGISRLPTAYKLETLDVGERYELMRVLNRLLEDPPTADLQPSCKQDLLCRIWLYEWRNPDFWRFGTVSDARNRRGQTRGLKDGESGDLDPYVVSADNRWLLFNPIYSGEFKQAAAHLFLDGVRTSNIARILGVAGVVAGAWIKEHPSSAAAALEAGRRGRRKR